MDTAKIKELLSDGIQAEDIIEIIKIILSTVFSFIQDDQNWNDDSTEA